MSFSLHHFAAQYLKRIVNENEHFTTQGKVVHFFHTNIWKQKQFSKRKNKMFTGKRLEKFAHWHSTL